MRSAAESESAAAAPSAPSATIYGPVRTRAIHPGDVVLVNKRGRVFHAKVHGVAAGGGFDVAPIERGISYRHVKASEITDHWAHSSTRRDGRPPTGQMELGD